MNASPGCSGSFFPSGKDCQADQRAQEHASAARAQRQYFVTERD